jgi:hypothetical protein
VVAVVQTGAMQTMTPGRWVALAVGTLALLLAGAVLAQSYTARGVSCGSVITPDRPMDPTDGLSGGLGADPEFFGSLFGDLGEQYEAAIDRCDDQRITRLIWVAVSGLFGVAAYVVAVNPPRAGSTNRDRSGQVLPDAPDAGPVLVSSVAGSEPAGRRPFSAPHPAPPFTPTSTSQAPPSAPPYVSPPRSPFDDPPGRFGPPPGSNPASDDHWRDEPRASS